MSPVAVAALVGLAVILVALIAFLFRLAIAFRNVNASLRSVINELDQMTGRAQPMGPAVEDLNERIQQLRSTLGKLANEPEPPGGGGAPPGS